MRHDCSAGQRHQRPIVDGRISVIWIGTTVFNAKQKAEESWKIGGRLAFHRIFRGRPRHQRCAVGSYAFNVATAANALYNFQV